MFSKSSQGDAVFDVKVVVFLWGWGAGSGCVNPACQKQMETVDDGCHAVPGLAQQIKGVMDVKVRVQSLPIAFMNFRRTRFL